MRIARIKALMWVKSAGYCVQ